MLQKFMLRRHFLAVFKSNDFQLIKKYSLEINYDLTMNKPVNATERRENNTLSVLMGKLYFQLIICQEWIKEIRNLFLKDK